MRYFVRPMDPECVRWTEPPEWVAELMEAHGLTEADESAYEVHVRVYRGEE